MKILITGATGQLGSDSVTLLSRLHQVIPRSAPDLDIADYSAVEELIRRIKPEVILNCAAFTKVDACETEVKRAWDVNAAGPENLARCAERYGCMLIHISTDYVFDGTKKPPVPYTEEDTPAPISCYGKSKLQGESAIKNITDRFLIVRTSWVYGVIGHNFLKTMLRLALQKPGKTIKVVNDQHGSPTWSHSLAQQIAKLIEKNCRGLYHATSEGHCTWYELAHHFLTKMMVDHSIAPCVTSEYPTTAVRPLNSILENQRLKQEGINVMGFWKNDVDTFVTTNRDVLLAEARKGAS